MTDRKIVEMNPMVPNPINVPLPPAAPYLQQSEPSTASTADSLLVPISATLVQFSDLSQIYVKSQWLEKCPVLRQPVIFHDFQKFKKYIYPLLNGDSLRFSENVDTKNEIGELIQEISKYKIVLSIEQLQDVCDNSGITKKINLILRYITAHETGCWGKKKYFERYNAFAVEWDRYIELLSIQYRDEVYKTYKSQVVYNTLTSKDMYTLLNMNIVKNNIIYTYAEWFEDFVIEKKDNFAKYIYDTASNIDINSLSSSIADISTVIMNLIQGINGETVRKGVILQKIADLLTLRRGLNPSN